MVEMTRQLVGQTVRIRCMREYDICFNNDAGGTESLKVGRVLRVKVTKQWHDPETGWRFHGEVAKKDQRWLRLDGTTTIRVRSDYHPAVVYFSNREIHEG